MKKSMRKAMAGLLAVVMVCASFLTYLPAMDVSAAPVTKKMAHLKSGSGNANGHFGGGTPEAFVLSDTATYTDEAFSFQLKVGSTADDTRLGFVTKYVDDTHWAYIAWEKTSGNNNHWFCEYNNGGNSYYPDVNGLPSIAQNDIINVSGSYTGSGLSLTVENKTSGASGTATITDTNFVALKDQAGKIGFRAATYGTSYTDIYFSDVTMGGNAITDYSTWAMYRPDAAGQIWEPSVDVIVPGDDPSNQGRKWITITGGSNNGGGHNYGNASVSAPVLLLDNDRRMADGGTLSMAVKPSSNWGVFYSYVNDNNWLYVGYDNTSKWYYQYKLNGSEDYPKISGLPAPVEGEELTMRISLSNETLSVNVNGTTVRVTNQKLIDYAGATSGNGRFGIKTNGQSSISFADTTYNGADCMNDSWVFCAERDGQERRDTYTAMVPVEGTVTEEGSNNPLEGATVRLGIHSAKTNSEGKYQFDSIEVGTYNMAVTKPGYEAYTDEKTVSVDEDNTFDVALTPKAALDLSRYDTIQSGDMKVYIGKTFPLVARYEMLSDKTGNLFFRGNETDLNTVRINDTAIEPTVTIGNKTASSREYNMHLEKSDANINLDMTVKVSVSKKNLTWQVTKLTKKDGCAKIATIDIPQLNLLSVDATEKNANFAGAQASTVTTEKADTYISFNDGFVPSESDGYLYAFLSNEKLSAGLHSNSEAEEDKRIIRNNGADSISLTSAAWYYERGDKNGQGSSYDFPVSDLPCAKVAIAGDLNEDKKIDWNDGAIAFRDIMNVPYDSDNIKDMVNYRIIMNFASQGSNPFLTTADNVKKVYLATDGLPQAVMLKGYGNEGHDSANSEYADIAERLGGAGDFKKLIKIAHNYNTQVGIHVNAQEAYPEARSFCEDMLQKPYTGGWGWLDQSIVIDKLWDLSSQARYKRFVQLYDRINGTSFYSGKWENGEYVKNSQGSITADRAAITKDAKSRPDNMDFIYLDVWYQDAWETRQIAKEVNSLDWRFSTEFSAKGEYDSTWNHWATDVTYGKADTKGYNSDIIRFLRNDQRDSQVINHPEFGGTADNPLLGGYHLYGFEGWGGDCDFNNYIKQTFNDNLPTRFLQHYKVIKWENYKKGESPVGNTEKQITLKNNDDVVVVTRKEEQRSDDNIERIITLNGKKVLDDVTYLLPWKDNDSGKEKLYHWNLEGGTTTWQLPAGWQNLANVVVYELSDQGRINKKSVAVKGGSVALSAKAATAYVVLKGEEAAKTVTPFGEQDYVVDPGFNSYAGAGELLSREAWSGDIKDKSVVVEKAKTGDQRLAFNSPGTDVAVTTTISGLKKGQDYVAEVYVQNDSNAKATISVNAGSKKASKYTTRSIASNYIQCDQKHGTNMQRMQVSFVAEKDTAKLTLSRAAGKGSTYMDDIRIVNKKLDNEKEDGSFEQDFETVVQGFYPFVLGPAQKVADPVTHLSQKNAPYSQAGWNNRVIDDVIDGEWSLKQHGANTGIIYQTIPQNFRFEPGKVYKVEYDYQAGNAVYAMVVGDGTTYTRPTEYLAASRGGKTTHAELTVTGSVSGQTWIGLYENGGLLNEAQQEDTNGERDFVLDNLKITEVKDAATVTLGATELYKGETTDIFGNKLEDFNWTVSKDGVVEVDKENNKVNAIGAGTVTVTATQSSRTTKEFVITVKDSVVTDVKPEEVGGLSSSANTEETSGENAPGSKATDGDSATFWHSSWTGGVSADNPAILTVELGTASNIDGFKFQQRPDVNNGIVQKYKYRILDAAGNELAASESITLSDSEREGGAWITAQLAATAKDAKKIEIIVEEGRGTFAAVAEVQIFNVQRVAETAKLENKELAVGEKFELEPEAPEGTILKGLVWESTDKNVATVSSEGVIKPLKAGTTTIILKNALGELARCTITVQKVDLNYDALDKAIAAAKKVDLTKYQDGKEKNAFTTALSEAEEAREAAVTQEEVDDAASALAKAQKALVPLSKPATVDKTKLNAAIQSAAKLDLSRYPNGAAKTAFKQALAAARAALKNASSQEVIDRALTNLKEAQKALENVDIEAPSMPGSIKVAGVDKTSIKISWKASKDNVGVVGYVVYLNGKKLGMVAESPAEIMNLKAGTKYTIEVKACDKAGNYSKAASIMVTTKGTAGTSKGQQGVSADGTTNNGSTSEQPSVRAAKTGDDTPFTAWAILFVLSFGCVGAAIYRRRQQN